LKTNKFWSKGYELDGEAREQGKGEKEKSGTETKGEQRGEKSTTIKILLRRI